MRAIDAARRAEALEVAQTAGITAAARHIGVNPSTVSRWCHAAGIATDCNELAQAARLTWEKRRIDLAHEIGEAAQEALARTRGALAAHEAGDARAYATTMAILADKAQLLTGGATARSEHAEPRQAVKEMLDELEQRRRRRAG